jgi:hypothetical protein
MRYLKTLESLKEDKEELDQFRETIKIGIYEKKRKELKNL